MKKPWWEDSTCFICDKWWLILLVLLLLAGIIVGWFLLKEPVLDLGTGDVQVTLQWDGLNDLDLHVIDPDGVDIFYGNSSSMSGGALDVDSNQGCGGNITEYPVENIFWEFGEAPEGEYQVIVHYFQQCESTEQVTPYEVIVKVDGSKTVFIGVVEEIGQGEAIYSFTR
ncbi:MAG: hypothetical protein JEZ06_03595 [Anaerolineaceae bacterium]|nr:hypothetical protein [Anaerolineaceae bacterium]